MKFKVGDLVRYIGHDIELRNATGVVEVVKPRCIAVDFGGSLSRWLTFPENLELMTHTTQVTLPPGAIWNPGESPKVGEKEEPKPSVCTYHTWHKVTLFTSSIEECSKCGRLRD